MQENKLTKSYKYAPINGKRKCHQRPRWGCGNYVRILFQRRVILLSAGLQMIYFAAFTTQMRNPPLTYYPVSQTLRYRLVRGTGRNSAVIPKKLAPTIGISIDHRRKNHSLEGLQLQGPYLPIAREKPIVELVKLKSSKAYDKLCVERMNTRHIGAKLKKVVEAEKEEKK
ncbi:hypothetical protein D8674_000110 [Pyrus ussuriensis x Pyrus communis]|uniref:60S ribosomal protein L13 n=1 Tax=Pyrus ussuriensis x Pyrus communis TaxID=2448454 RepID=A0A5N5F7X0_9ROSA|nr:hypothetical protein D8674_000110 [Pyrus ussuriensis x Pyrus communis]